MSSKAFIDHLAEPMTRYDPAAFPDWIHAHIKGVLTVRSNKKVFYLNCPAAFDIETSSFYKTTRRGRKVKQACMYLWAFGLNGSCVYGRTWAEFMQLLDQLKKELNLSTERRLIIWIHNLAYEFQWLRRRLHWASVFSLKERKPVKADCGDGIELRCSYVLSGYSLAALGGELRTYPQQKAVGDLDYSLLRCPDTELTDAELHYQAQDVRVVMAYIKEQIEAENNNITYIPLTKTGYVRRYCRDSCLYRGGHHAYNGPFYRLIHSLNMTPGEYEMLKRAFAGGFTHASAFYTRRLNHNVSSYDFTSSYPAVMVAKLYPMSSGEEVEIRTPEDLEKNLNSYCCLFDVEITGLVPRLYWDHPLSLSKCYGVKNVQQDNGRVVSADRILTTLTEQDFFTLREFYEWDSLSVGRFIRYQRGYLPTLFIQAILTLYKDKTELKGVEGMEAAYQLAKGMINACYGMTVTDIVRPDIIYDNIAGWCEEIPDLAKSIKEYNDSKRRFLFYPWGVWVTAHARRALFSGIKAFGADYIYSDTDSLKVLNADRHLDYIKSYNEQITAELIAACEYHGLDPALTAPATIKGVQKPLGVWDYEGTYKLFKTLGAKRYMYLDQDNQLHLTIAGVGKKQGAAWLLDHSGSLLSSFYNFDDGLVFPPEGTGKSTHTYIDDDMEGTVTDYQGRECEYHELSGVHLEGADYALSISKLYADYLRGFRFETD